MTSGGHTLLVLRVQRTHPRLWQFGSAVVFVADFAKTARLRLLGENK